MQTHSSNSNRQDPPNDAKISGKSLRRNTIVSKNLHQYNYKREYR